jgi:Domain of unknown function (DUF222)/HNH endonuclease
VVAALDRMAGRLPAIVTDEDDTTGDDSIATRRADALVALASARIADDQDPDRATVVVHAELSALVSGGRGSRVEGGGVLHPATVGRLACDCRLEWVWEDPDGRAVGIGRAPPRWLRRQLLYRDETCLFPGCGARRFLHCHHIVHWIAGGRTDLDNLALVCTYKPFLFTPLRLLMSEEKGFATTSCCTSGAGASSSAPPGPRPGTGPGGGPTSRGRTRRSRPEQHVL